MPAPETQKAGDLAAGLVSDGQKLVSLQIGLAKQELKELVVRNAVALSLFLLAALLLLVAIVVVVPLVIVHLVGDSTRAVVIWLAVYIGLAVILLIAGRIVLRIPKSDQIHTLTAVTETRDWLLRQIKSSAR
ncbi:MAG: phage holin family protein [Candidatus Dormibacteraeota bacterium]|nr:phage holin family protein [Candidatus Dormibacteraeota bacterium]